MGSNPTVVISFCFLSFERAFNSPWFCFYGPFYLALGPRRRLRPALPRRVAPAGPLLRFLLAAPQAAHGHGAPIKAGVGLWAWTRIPQQPPFFLLFLLAAAAAAWRWWSVVVGGDQVVMEMVKVTEY